MVERTGTLVGRAIASVVNLLDLPLAVVSGSVALGFGEPFFGAAQAEMDLRCRLEFARGARVVPGGLGDRGPLVGAARVGLRGGAGRDGDERPPCVTAGRGGGGAGMPSWWRVPSLPHPGLWWASARRRAPDGPARVVAPRPVRAAAGGGVLALPARHRVRRGRREPGR